MASNWCKSNKVLVNDALVKPSYVVKIDDEITIKKNTALFRYKVLDLLDKRVGAKLVENYLRDITPQEEIEKYKLYQESQRQYRQNGLGRPTTKERRALNKFWNS